MWKEITIAAYVYVFIVKKLSASGANECTCTFVSISYINIAEQLLNHLSHVKWQFSIDKLYAKYVHELKKVMKCIH